jgi:predicted Co/Zn/Cd cation transporter (cation efflux family)
MLKKEISFDSSYENSEAVVAKYKKYLYRKIIFVIASVIFLLILIGIGMGVGSYSISFVDVYSEIFNRLLHWGPLVTTRIPSPQEYPQGHVWVQYYRSPWA